MADRAKVLVVDDDPDVVEATRLILERNGYHVLTAEDGGKGLAQVRAERPDVIVLDVMMPEGTEGFHFVWALRRDADERIKGIPIIIISAIHERTKLRFYPDQSDGTYEPGAYLPVEDFVDKPINPADLVGRIERLLGRKSEERI
jgi:CheY-like chemotaxis protein